MGVLETDPSRTTTLRRQFFNQGRAKLREAMYRILLSTEEWSKQSSSKKTNSVKQAVGLIDNELIGTNWFAGFIDRSRQQGIERAFREARKAKIALAPKSVGSAMRWFVATVVAKNRNNTTEDVDKAREGLNRIAQWLAGRVLEEGRNIAKKSGSRLQVRDAVRKAFDSAMYRFRLLVNSTVIGSFTDGQLDAFEELGKTKVSIRAEFATAKSGVCPKCKPLNGKVYTIKAARGLIPLHPDCRCIFIITEKRR